MTDARDPRQFTPRARSTRNKLVQTIMGINTAFAAMVTADPTIIPGATTQFIFFGLAIAGLCVNQWWP